MIIRALELTVALVLTLGIFVGLPVLALSGLYSLKFGDCIRFPNGTEIGYEAYIDFSNRYFTPDTVVRDPDGNIMAKDVWPIHITDKATFGSAFSKNNRGEIDFHFIWTRETGLIKQAENPETFQRLQQDLGRNYYGASRNMNVNTLWLFMHLMKDEQFQSNDCNTAFVTW